jgi:cell division protein FtsB
MSQYATKGYEISQLEQRRAQLEFENMELNREISNASNLNYIRSMASEAGYVSISANEVNFISLAD